MTQPPTPTAYGGEHPSIFSPVLITGREIYDLLMHLSTQVSSIQQQLSQRAVDDEQRDKALEARFSDVENRLRSLEKMRWPLQSVAALVAIGAVLIAFFNHS